MMPFTYPRNLKGSAMRFRNGQQELLCVCPFYSSCELQVALMQHLWLVICVPYPEFDYSAPNGSPSSLQIHPRDKRHLESFTNCFVLYLCYPTAMGTGINFICNILFFANFFFSFMWSDIGENTGKDGTVGGLCWRPDYFLMAWQFVFWNNQCRNMHTWKIK